MQIEFKNVRVTTGVENIINKFENKEIDALKAFWEIHKIKKTQKDWNFKHSEMTQGYLITCMSTQQKETLNKYGNLKNRCLDLWENWKY